MNDEFLIRQLIENWAIWRDSGQWERLSTLWHPEGRMVTTWSQSGAEEFITLSRRAWDGGMKVVHTMGGASIDVIGERAVSISRMEITQRATLDGVLVDVNCRGRFWDALLKHDGKWLLMLRQPIYEMDRLTVVEPGAKLDIDAKLLSSYPEGYRHLAFLQTRLGLQVKDNLPGTRGSEIEALMARGVRWLRGDAVSCLE